MRIIESTIRVDAEFTCHAVDTVVVISPGRRVRPLTDERTAPMSDRFDCHKWGVTPAHKHWRDKDKERHGHKKPAPCESAAKTRR